MTKILNLLGGPSCGKSTAAAYLYFYLKANGHKTELVREYVKDWAWDNRKIGVYDQLYIAGKQIKREALLLSKVDVIVTDSAVWLGGVYASIYSPPYIKQAVDSMIKGYYIQAESEGHKHTNILLQRSTKYDPYGRYETEAQAREIDKRIEEYLVSNKIPFVFCRNEELELKKRLQRVLDGQQ